MRNRIRRRCTAVFIGLVSATLALAGCAQSGTVDIDVPTQVEGAFAEDVQSQLSAAVEFAMAATGASGAIVGVWAPWSGSWVAGVGEATTDDTFRAADVTRAMTCDVLYTYVDRGVVSLEDDVRDYVGTVASLDGVTLGDLCDGTSGLGSYSAELSDDWVNVPDRVWSPRELVAYGMGSLDSTLTGVSWRDSDAGYVLLGLALQKISGEKASAYLEDTVFGPLGLEDTSLPATAPAAPGDPALSGYVLLPGEDGAANCTEPRDVTVGSSSIGYTSAGVVTTVADLGTYAQALATQALNDTADGRFDDALPVSADGPSWFTTTGGAYIAGSLIGQYGSVPGYMTAAFADPTTGLTVVVVLNNSAANDEVAADLAWQLAAIASKAPAAEGETAPEAGLPWTAEQLHDEIAAMAVCALPAE